jgi:hypothetical protein
MVVEFDGALVYHLLKSGKIICGKPLRGQPLPAVREAPSPDRRLCASCERRQRLRRVRGSRWVW